MNWWTMCYRPIAVAWLFGLLLCAVNARGSEASYVSFQVPGAMGTYPMSMNNSMTVTGYYTTSPTTASAFIRDPAGNITTFIIRGGLWTEPESINDSGDVVGFYEVVAGTPQSFIRYANGRVVTFDPPEGQCGGYELPSKPLAINNFGETVGNYFGSCFGVAGFTRARSGTLEFDVYDDREGAGYVTGFFGLNANGTLVGFTVGGAFGLLVHPDGYNVVFSVPISDPRFAEATIPVAINNAGVVAGWYTFPAPDSGAHTSGGFVRSPQGDFAVFNPPGTLVAPVIDHFAGNLTLLSAPRSISLNASGVIAGTYTDASGTKHGYVRNPYGTITPFDPPRGMQTTATGINDSGVIVGYFLYDWNRQTTIGFLRIPEVQP